MLTKSKDMSTTNKPSWVMSDMLTYEIITCNYDIFILF